MSSANTDDSAIRNDTISPKATFFVLGWVAEKLPNLVREITARGHEVASHGCNHELSSKMTVSELRNDLCESRIKLEDTTGKRVIGFRAPSFAIDDKILRAVGETGYLYDSSYNSFSLQGRYGRISTNGHSKKGIAHKISENFYEIPISNLGINHLIRAFFYRHRKKIKKVNPIANLLKVISERGIVLPWGGGGYFRLIPNNLFMTGVDTILNEDGAYVFYLHPWEIDPGQPKMKEASLAFRFRHYNNIGRAYTKLNKLLKDFRSCLFCSCTQYLENMN